MKQQLERMTQLQAENERLSNLADQAQTPLTSRQFLELMELRGEVGRLRQQTNMLQRLREQNQQLRTTLASTSHPQNLQATNLASKPPPLAVYPKAAWAFAGYATPEAAFQSLNWAAANGDVNAMLDGSTTNMQKDFAKEFGGKSESDSADELKNHMNQNNVVSILREDVRSDNEVVLVILGDADGAGGNNTPVNLVFQKIDGQWKFANEEH